MLLAKKLISCFLTNFKDELIIAKEHFAEIGDDLDFTFVDLIDGVEPIWTYRRQKPPTPPPKAPSPPKIVESAAVAVQGAVEGAVVVVAGEGVVEGAAPAPLKEPSPFELNKHFPPDGAEVPFVKSAETEAPAPSPAPSPAPEEKPAEPTPAPEEPAPAAEEPAPTEEAPAAEAPAAEAAAPAEEAPATEA